MMAQCYSQYDPRHFPTDASAVSFDTVLLHLVARPLAELSDEALVSLVGALRWLGDEPVGTRPGRRRKRPRGYKRAVDGLLVWVSLPRVVHETNAVPLAPGDVVPALGAVADALGVDLRVVLNARVYRLDVAANLVVSLRPSVYLPQLVYVPRAYRDQGTPTNLLFSNTQRQLAFYDKVAQLAETGQNVPEALAGRHVLRYELRLTGGLLRDLAHPVLGRPLVADDLADAAVYRQAVVVWRERYGTIETQSAPEIGEPRDVRALVRGLAAAQVAAQGAPSVISSIDALHADGLTSGDMRSKQRRLVLDLARGPAGVLDPVAELQVAVHKAARLSLTH